MELSHSRANWWPSLSPLTLGSCQGCGSRVAGGCHWVPAHQLQMASSTAGWSRNTLSDNRVPSGARTGVMVLDEGPYTAFMHWTSASLHIDRRRSRVLLPFPSTKHPSAVLSWPWSRISTSWTARVWTLSFCHLARLQRLLFSFPEVKNLLDVVVKPVLIFFFCGCPKRAWQYCRLHLWIQFMQRQCHWCPVLAAAGS